MPTNDERRKIAETLRSGVGTTDYMSDGAFIKWLFGVIGRSCDSHILDSLADLIEPEERTCHAGVFSDGAGAWVICCTECGYDLGGKWSSLDIARRMARGQHKFTNFCPKCGAKVVQE